MRTLFRVPLAIATGAATAWGSFNAAFWWRTGYDEKVAPHDGQAGLDAAAFGLIVALVCAGLAVLVVLRFAKENR